MRGATIALMIVVNDAGGPVSYHPLNHAAWNGWTITDTVFPTFLWIVGVSITLALGKRLSAGASRASLMVPIFRRAAILYAFGLLLYAFPAFDGSSFRILGVLQRIAICYLIGALIYLYTGVRGQLATLIGLMAAYWLLMSFAAVPGYGSGRLDLDGNFAHYVDRIFLGKHNYRGGTWDPEGIVSTLPSIATVLFGILAGHVLRLKSVLSERTTWLFVIGNALLGLGLICDIWLPINKKLWTDSFAIFMAGLDFVLLAGFIWIVDHLGYQRYVRPLLIVGVNAITLYLASEFGSEFLDLIHVSSGGTQVSLHDWIYSLILNIASPINASLLYAVGYLMVMYVIAWVMYRQRWFVRI